MRAQHWKLSLFGLLSACFLIAPAFAQENPSSKAAFQEAEYRDFNSRIQALSNRVRLGSFQRNKTIAPFVFGSNQTQKPIMKDNIIGYRSEATGVGLLGEIDLNQHLNGFSLGGGVTYARSNITNKPTEDKLKSDNGQIFLYGNYVKPNWYTSLFLSESESHNRLNTTVAPGVSAHAKYLGYQFYSKLTAGYIFQTPVWSLSPEAFFQYVNFNQHAYVEEGAGDFNTSVGRNKVDTTKGGVGFRATQINIQSFAPEFHAFYMRDFRLTNPQGNSNFLTGGGIPKTPFNNTKDTWNLGMALTGYFIQNFYLLGIYDFYIKRKKYKEHAGSLSFRYRF